MLKGIDGNDHVGNFLCRLRELTYSVHCRQPGVSPRGLQYFLSVIETNHATGPESCHIHCFRTLTAAEIDHHFAGKASQEFIPEHCPRFGLTNIGGAVSKVRSRGEETMENPVLKVCEHACCVPYCKSFRRSDMPDSLPRIG